MVGLVNQPIVIILMNEGIMIAQFIEMNLTTRIIDYPKKIYSNFTNQVLPSGLNYI
jgi:hypothetical protein